MRRELAYTILTLKAWHHSNLKDIELDDKDDHEIYGFDTFLDQVNKVSREFALEYVWSVRIAH